MSQDYIDEERGCLLSIDECPVCGSDDYVGGEVRIESGRAFQYCSCSSCNATWTDCYIMNAQVIDEKTNETI